MKDEFNYILKIVTNTKVLGYGICVLAVLAVLQGIAFYIQ